MAGDLRKMEREIKEMKLKAKLAEQQDKKKRKLEAKKEKERKKLEKMREKMIKKGQIPSDDLGKPVDRPAVKDEVVKGQKIEQAEVVEFKGGEWKRKSVHSIDDVEKKIDRFTGKGVKNLEDRYREKYGEDIKVPELYQIETSVEMERDFDRLTSEKDEEEPFGAEEKKEEEKEPSSGFGFFDRKKEPEKKALAPPSDELSFWDLGTTKFYFRDKFGADAGGGKRAVLLLVDVIVYIISIIAFPIIIGRLFITFRNSRRRKAARMEVGQQGSVTFAEV